MSFSSSVKKELASIEILSSCCLHAQVYGLVLFTHFSQFDISITTENEDTLDFYRLGLKKVCGVKAVDDGNLEAKKLSLSVNNPAERSVVYDTFGHSMTELNLRINRANIQEECCANAFVRGVFLACGTITDPNKNYHLEFVIPHKKLCTDLISFLTELGFNPKYIQRKGYHVVYFKESESIEDMLTFMGATESSLEIMGIKMQKDVINRVNRKVNFEMSNLNKTIDAGNRQADAIRQIVDSKGLNFFPDNLREIARLRLENPDISLKELGLMLSEPISRSGLNHRLSKIMEMARELEGTK